MKVGFIIDSFSYNGGVERFLSNLSQHLPDKYEQTIIVLYNDNEFTGKKKRKWEHNAKNIYNLNLNYTPFYLTLLKIHKDAKKLKQLKQELNLDVYISCGYYSNDLNSMSNKIGKTIVTMHAYKDDFLSKLRYKNYKRADLTITVSKMIESLLIENCKYSSSKVKTIYNLFNINEISSIKSQKLLDKSKFNILMVGRLEFQKGHWYALDIMNKIVETGGENIHLSILGEGSLKEKLEHKIKDFNLEEHVTLLGYSENVYEYMKSADLFLMTSLFEGFPMVNVEALASGLPIISCNCKSGPSELLANTPFLEVNGLLEFNHGALYPEYSNICDTQNLTQHDQETNKNVSEYILKLVNDSEKLIILKENALIRANNFDYSYLIPEWEKVLQRL